MTIRGHMGGHAVHLTEDGWIYDDTQLQADGARCCRRCNLPPELVPVLTPGDSTHDGQNRYEVVQVDACIATLVRQLNAGATEPVTSGACCGHGRGRGEILLADGRVLVIKSREWLEKKWEKESRKRKRRRK